MTESQLTEQSDYTKSGGGTPGDNVLGDDGELIITIPEANYPAGKTCTAHDADLVVGNIKYGVNIFGVEGTHAPLSGDNVLGDDGDPTIPIPAANYPAGKICTAQDTDLVAGNIKNGVNIFGVEGTHAPLSGDNVLGDDGDPTIPIPAANYPSGKICTAQDADLVAGNIKNGVTIFGVQGTYTGNLTLKSIQHGSIQILSEESSHTATITAVDLSKTILFLSGQHSTSGIFNLGVGCVTLTNTTTVTATKNTGLAGNTLDISFVVLEFLEGIKNVQSGTISFTDSQTSKTATITAVTTTKSLLSYLGVTSDDANVISVSRLFRVTLTNSTTVTAYTRYATGNCIVRFMVLEFD